MGALTFLMTGFWMLMIFDCIRNDPEKRTWLWILIFLNIPGALLYFLMRRLPSLSIPMPSQFKRWTYRKKIWDAEAAVKHIGKPYQLVNLGNVLLDAGMTERAYNAYQQALEQDPKHINALWGAASIELMRKDYVNAKTHLTYLIKNDPDYKFGEASLAYGQALYALQEWDSAKSHLIDDLKRWSHPEAAIMLAVIHKDQGEIADAREVLDTMMFKLKGTPRFYLRKKRHLLNKAQKLLKRLDR